MIWPKVSFFFGLNLWGAGLVLAAKALDVRDAFAWVLPSMLLVVGTVLLSAALLPPRAAAQDQ